jgi:hypothetical protein
MALIVECSCGEQLRVNEDQAGKGVRCPGCRGVVTVPAPATRPPAARGAKPSGRGPWLLLGLAGGALLLCCGGVVVGTALLVRGTEPPEQTILGTWQLDRPASSYNPLVQGMQGGITLEFRKDNTYRLALGGPSEKGTYAITGKTGKTLKLTVTPGGPLAQSSDWFIEVRDKDRLYVDHRTLSGFEVTRAQPGS